jgi:diguanylate cyclase (GGDEF)-like protein/PAS domain S-box-containing protein
VPGDALGTDRTARTGEAPISGRPQSDSPPPGWFQAVVERMSDLVVAIDGDGTIVYVNPAAQLWLGVEPDRLVGTNVLTWIHPDDVERAVASIAYGSEVDETIAPTPFRLVSFDGDVTSFDVLGHSTLHDPVINALLIVAREASHHEVVDRVLEGMVADAPFEEILVESADLMCRPLWQIECAVLFQDVDGAERVVHTGLPEALVNPDVGDEPTPWDEARTVGETVVCVGLAQIAPALRRLADQAGYRSCWAAPVHDPMHSRPACIVVWSPHDAAPVLGSGVAFGRTLRLLALALQQRDQKVQLERAARHDRLTGLANRARFFGALIDTLETAAPGSAAVLYLDLDGFKAVNDTHGHAAGDIVLAEVALRLSAEAGPADLVARIGGDELAVLCPAVTGIDAVGQLAERLIEAVSRPIDLGSQGAAGDVVAIGTSIGVVVVDDPSSGADVIIDAADRAMYEAKQSGRGTWPLADRL